MKITCFPGGGYHCASVEKFTRMCTFLRRMCGKQPVSRISAGRFVNATPQNLPFFVKLMDRSSMSKMHPMTSPTENGVPYVSYFPLCDFFPVPHSPTTRPYLQGREGSN